MSDSWWRISLLVWSDTYTAETAIEKLGSGVAGRNGAWSRVFGAPDDEFSEQIDLVKRFLMAQMHVLLDLCIPGEAKLLISWSPQTPQDHLIFDHDLMSLLVEIRADITLDTMIDDDAV